MNKLEGLKEGDLIKIKFGENYTHLGKDSHKLTCGIVYDAKITAYEEGETWAGINILNHNRGYCHLDTESNGCSDFELVEDNIVHTKTFNIKTDPWYIRVNSEEESKAVQEWLFEQGITWIHSSSVPKYTEYKFILNIFLEGTVSNYLLRTDSSTEINPAAKELKFTFKTVVHSVQYPQAETEQQIKIKQLEETIEKAKAQLQELKEIK